MFPELKYIFFSGFLLDRKTRHKSIWVINFKTSPMKFSFFFYKCQYNFIHWVKKLEHFIEGS